MLDWDGSGYHNGSVTSTVGAMMMRADQEGVAPERSVR